MSAADAVRRLRDAARSTDFLRYQRIAIRGDRHARGSTISPRISAGSTPGQEGLDDAGVSRHTPLMAAKTVSPIRTGLTGRAAPRRRTPGGA